MTELAVETAVRKTVTSRASWRISRRSRKAVLTVHLIASVGWIGADLGLLALAIVALTTDTPRVGQAATMAMAYLATWISGILSVSALISGILLSLATPWGLFRHYWVVVSLVLNLLTALLVNFALGPLYRGMEALVLAAPASTPVANIIGTQRIELIAPPCVAFVVLTAVTIINVYKPWGRISWRIRAR
ncbi:MAG TPA: DUF2269 family protein [Pseudonocardiaceae bacterium]|nr:DUF2269 family protein [Pseudonocardiaceae bacterium]